MFFYESISKFLVRVKYFDFVNRNLDQNFPFVILILVKVVSHILKFTQSNLVSVEALCYIKNFLFYLLQKVLV